VLITFSGTHGAGKTTYSKALYRYLRGVGESVLWLKGGHVTGVIGTKISDIITFPRLIRSKIAYIFYLVELIIHYIPFILFLNFLLKIGITVVCDSYVIDAFKWLNLYIGKFSLLKRFVFKIAPKPDLPFLLLPSIDECVRRMENRNQGTIPKSWYRAIVTLERKVYVGMVDYFLVESTEDSKSEVIRRIIAHIMRLKYRKSG